MVITATITLVGDNIKATGIGSNNANITWNTNFKTNSTVEYDTTTGYGMSNTNDTLVTSHFVPLSSLSPYTKYYYRIISKTDDGVSVTSTGSHFTTTHAIGTSFAQPSAETTVTGVTAKTENGVQQVNLSKSTLTATATKEADGKTVTVTNLNNGWSSIKYTGSDVVESGTDISVNGIQSIVMTSTPVTEDLGGNIGTVSARIEVPLTKLVSGEPIQQNIIQGATSDVASAFQLAATSSSLDIKSVAYTVEFKNTDALNANLGAAGVTLDLSVDHAWVEENGGRDNIKIIRFGDDGKKEVLTTLYIDSDVSGDITTDNFRATSPNGLSTFGMTAVASTGGGDSGGNGGGSSGGSGTTSTSSVSSSESNSYTGVSGSHSTIQQAVAPIVQQINEFLAPFQEDEATTVQPLRVAGLTATTDPAGMQTIRLDAVLARQSGATITLANNVITISQPGFTLTVVTRDSSVIEKDVISGTVQSVGLRTDPVSAQTSSGTVSVSLETALAGIPENAAITTTISDAANPDMLNAFQSAALANNRQVEDVAYSVVLGKSNLATTGPATLTLTVSPEWVSSHGGIPSIGVAHLSDDGTSEILTTGYTGVDNNGNIAFLATSPKGLSAFGLVSLKTQTGPAPTTGSQQPAQQTVHDTPAGTIGRFIANNIVLLAGIFAVLLAIGVAIVLYDRRSGNRNRTRKKER
ncbi:MAG: fibronectin type III domain-containing protein [Methanoregula sp.]|uniref:fibronectin type III domain-containing protein n=1 Tax=Methanoregula sp. TaxID=2052170 RepID=UPI0025D87B41|nr:fibronectin type III domain-containing protein [Methanoregula sp.]MCK9630759.1 fibronectin type III domain-containing protein [Methanoregula sp.]